jgi:hypothetical protein
MAPALLDAAGRQALIAALAEEDPFCPELPPAALTEWSEARIRAFFEAGGADAGITESPAAAPVQLTREQARGAGARHAGERAQPRAPRPATLHILSRRSRATRGFAQAMAKFPPPSAEEFGRWFPGLDRCA